jgi:Nicotinic acid phosphoribosyltransferase
MEVGKRRPAVTELLTDRYQLTMAYSYFKQGKHNTEAVFDAYFRKCPFKGEVFCFSYLISL